MTKFATHILWFFIGIFIISFLVLSIESDEVDELCENDSLILKRIDGTWQCAVDSINVSCAENEILKWQSNTWDCGTDVSGGGGSGTSLWGVYGAWMQPNLTAGAVNDIIVDRINITGTISNATHTYSFAEMFYYENDTTIGNCSLTDSCDNIHYVGDKVGNTTLEIWSVIDNNTFAYTSSSSGTNESIFFNTSYDSYNANLSIGGVTGYEAGNFICNSNFSNTHMCTQEEVIATYYLKNVSTILAWSGNAWVIGGASKYTGVGVLFVNDCNGFTDHTGSDSYGNAWSFTNNRGLTGNCGSEIPIACCGIW